MKYHVFVGANAFVVRGRAFVEVDRHATVELPYDEIVAGGDATRGDLAVASWMTPAAKHGATTTSNDEKDRCGARSSRGSQRYLSYAVAGTWVHPWTTGPVAVSMHVIGVPQPLSAGNIDGVAARMFGPQSWYCLTSSVA